jgi:hypothetical protein
MLGAEKFSRKMFNAEKFKRSIRRIFLTVMCEYSYPYTRIPVKPYNF